MKGDQRILDALNAALTIELTAINQYFCQAKMCKNWGYLRLARKHYEESMGEMRHADRIIDRILFLDGTPEIARYDVIRVGTDVEEQFRRMTFNLVARNQDDHVKNIAFLMDQQGQWSLAPAFDVTYSYNPAGAWTSKVRLVSRSLPLMINGYVAPSALLTLASASSNALCIDSSCSGVAV